MQESKDSTGYFVTFVEAFFYDVWRGYEENHCIGDVLRARARSMRKELKKQQSVSVPSLRHIEKRIKAATPEKFEKYAEVYFMYDLYPENRERFNVSLDEARARRKREQGAGPDFFAA